MGKSVLVLVTAFLSAAVSGSSMPPAEPPQASDIDACPPGTSRVEKTTDKGREVQCEGPGGSHDGPARAWHANGILASDGQYGKSLQQGWWRTWDERGALQSEMEYDGGYWIARRRMPAEREPSDSRPGDAVHPCPAGAVVARGVAPDSRGQWCESSRADGAYVREGPWVDLSGNAIWESGRYHEGRRNGEFVDRHGRETPERSRTFAMGEMVAETTWDPRGPSAARSGPRATVNGRAPLVRERRPRQRGDVARQAEAERRLLLVRERCEAGGGVLAGRQARRRAADLVAQRPAPRRRRAVGAQEDRHLEHLDSRGSPDAPRRLRRAR
jgi:hypothetical protein